MFPVNEFLADCLRDARDVEYGPVPPVVEADGYHAARHRFMTGGLATPRADHAGARWVQVNMAVGARVRPELHRLLEGIALQLLGSQNASHLFFLHKPPGLRVRFQAPTLHRRDDLHAVMVRKLATHSDILGPPRRGRYEPEDYPFDGPDAMPWVHDLFTTDSLAWLQHHAERPKKPAGMAAVADSLARAARRARHRRLGAPGGPADPPVRSGSDSHRERCGQRSQPCGRRHPALLAPGPRRVDRTPLRTTVCWSGPPPLRDPRGHRPLAYRLLRLRDRGGERAATGHGVPRGLPLEPGPPLGRAPETSDPRPADRTSRPLVGGTAARVSRPHIPATERARS
jgi:hypothetical protein